MTESHDTAIRYLLGELPEGERAELEEACFDDPRVFANVAEVESGLVDDYVRGRLSPDLRRRFEQVYLTDPRRRERVRFAEALTIRVDAAASSSESGATSPRTSGSDWPTWIAAWLGPTPAFRLVFASLLIGLVAGGLWFFFFQSARSRQQSPQAIVEPRPSPGAPVTPANRTAPVPDPPVGPAPSVTLALLVGPGVRSVTPGPVTLVVPAGATEVRLMLSLREHAYPVYRVLLREVGGPEILRQGDLRPVMEGAGPAFSIAVPASRFSPGDYMLTLQGAARGGEFDDLSQSLFRVEPAR
jgi:hypothetical protein